MGRQGGLMQPYLVIAIVGSLSVMAAVLKPIYDARFAPGDRRRTLYVFIAIPFAISVVMVWLQFYYTTQIASKEKVAREGQLAFALWAFRDNEVVHLRSLAQSNEFLLGYWYFKKDQFDQAEAALRKSISNNAFVAPSNYIRDRREHRF